MASTKRQAIIWTNADLIHRCIYVALGGDELGFSDNGNNNRLDNSIALSCLVQDFINGLPAFLDNTIWLHTLDAKVIK